MDTLMLQTFRQIYTCEFSLENNGLESGLTLLRICFLYFRAPRIRTHAEAPEQMKGLLDAGHSEIPRQHPLQLHVCRTPSIYVWRLGLKIGSWSHLSRFDPLYLQANSSKRIRPIYSYSQLSSGTSKL